MQKRRHPRARKILITTEEVLEPGERTVSKFLPMETQPNSGQIKLMLGLAKKGVQTSWLMFWPRCETAAGILALLEMF